METISYTFATKRDDAVAPANPILASSLIDDDELDDLIDRLYNSGIREAKQEKERIGIGIKSVDTALFGGLESGRVIEISGEASAGVREVYTALLVTCLLQNPKSTAAVVDTTGNFDVLRLYTHIIARLSCQTQDLLAALRESVGFGSDARAEDVAAKMLDRVKIMRVFDFEGVREAVGEIGDEVEGRGGVGEKDVGQKEEVLGEEQVRVDEANEPPKRTFVPDSEDEGEEEEEEMLFEIKDKHILAPRVQDTDAISAPELEKPGHADTEEQATQTKSKKSTPSTLKFILIDNLARVFGPLSKNDMNKATSLASTLLLTLTCLTRHHTLYTLLVTPTTPPPAPRAASPTRAVPSHRSHAPNHSGPDQPEPIPQPSIFLSNKVGPGIPGLTGLMGLYSDVRVLISRMPYRKVDARIYYDENIDKARKRRVEMVGVLEVVGDRWGGRTGSWGVFAKGQDGIVDVK
ncbi:hypothetical protein COCMIDRAFT_109179 [Bipolaris oryzae ATCC 44560]|uniref:Rad51-like C-terminal domain-containing protein n=1 Tax=Bipolaris oryzae ATCC 44560 TaxID=930090 RepID=W6Z9D9_COCMI|nr:uncharacterized protein COCMIDRAFT_109179 [Bipolaris oryzae ATCC 44560]EUC40296.1 hypothetical protein COCMIDRAFT_109179 [Bipolaris oryzae ATCC 44560]